MEGAQLAKAVFSGALKQYQVYRTSAEVCWWLISSYLSNVILLLNETLYDEDNYNNVGLF